MTSSASAAELGAGLALLDEELVAGAVALDDREQHGAPAALLDRGEALQQVAHSTFSTKTSISPPQGRPTFQPSSSEIP